MGGGSDAFCGNYTPLGVPHYIAVDVALLQGMGIGKSKKIAINTRNGDVYMGLAGAINNSSGSGRLNFTIDAGWIIGLTPDNQKNLSAIITQSLQGVSVGGKGCLSGGCLGVSKSIGEDSPGMFIFEAGLGAGVSINGEAMWKIGNILEYIGLR